MIFAASAASAFDLNASEDGTNGSSKLGNGRLLAEHTLSSVAAEPAIMFDNSRRVEVIVAILSVLQSYAGGEVGNWGGICLVVFILRKRPVWACSE